jgi:hypothetical protein
MEIRGVWSRGDVRNPPQLPRAHVDEAMLIRSELGCE